MSDANTRTEWGVRLTWPDGHSEVRTHDRMTGRPYQRRDAEVVALHIGDSRGLGETDATAEVVARVVTTTEWAPGTSDRTVHPGFIEAETESGAPFFIETVDTGGWRDEATGLVSGGLVTNETKG